MGGYWSESRMAEEIAELRKEMRAEREAQRKKEKMAEEMAELRKEMRAEREAQREKEKRAEEMTQLLMKMMAEEMTQRKMMAEEMALLRKEMRAEREAQREKERRATGRSESPDSDVSLKSDGSKDQPINFKDRVSHRWMDFDSDMSAVEDFNKRLNNLRAERESRLRMLRMTMGSMKSIDSGVSFKTHWSKKDVTNFNDRDSVMSDFSSSEEDNVSDDEDLVKSPDNLGRKMN